MRPVFELQNLRAETESVGVTHVSVDADVVDVPEVDEVAEPLGRLRRLVRLVAGHVVGALAQERLAVGRHVRQIEEDDEHFDDGALRVEQRQLHRAPPRHLVAAAGAQVHVRQVRRTRLVRLQTAETVTAINQSHIKTK